MLLCFTQISIAANSTYNAVVAGKECEEEKPGSEHSFR